jgi:hypothetical protein
MLIGRSHCGLVVVLLSTIAEVPGSIKGASMSPKDKILALWGEA